MNTPPHHTGKKVYFREETNAIDIKTFSDLASLSVESNIAPETLSDGSVRLHADCNKTFVSSILGKKFQF